MICPKCLPKGCILDSDCGCNCHNTHVHPEFERFKTYDELVRFQIRIAKNYPYYPTKPKDWKKLSPERITVKGLEEISKIKRLIVWGNAKDYEVYNYTTLLKLYAEYNPTDKRLREYAKISHAEFYNSKQLFHAWDKNGKIKPKNDLLKLGFVEENPQYDKEFSDKNHQWGYDLILECNRLSKLERLRDIESNN